MCDSRVVEKVEEAVGHFSVSCKFKNVGDQFEWAFTGVYGPNLNNRRRLMWEELTGLISWWDLPWCLGGDFNIIGFPSERLGAASFSRAMYGFSDFVSLHGLMDIQMEGGLYTWSNTSSASRFDWFLFSPLLADHFSLFTQKRMPRVLSDHFPILLEGGCQQRGRIPFRFENMWLRVDNFVDKVKKWWASYLFHGTLSFILAKKLAALKLDLKQWNKTEFGNVTFKKQALWSKLNDLDAKEETHSLFAEEKLDQTNIRSNIEKLTLMEETSWRQKSRVLHLKEGDANTKFFHIMANSNRKNNGIESLMINGTLSSDQGIIADYITHFFMNLYFEQQVERPFPDSLVFPMISGENADWLERPFEEAEIFDVIQSFHGDNSPSLDGFPMAFFQACWGIVKPDLMAVFHHFFANGQFEKSLNATFVTLIPKNHAANEIRDFRSISLVGGFIKLLLKSWLIVSSW